MDNQSVKGILDGLTARGVLSQDGRVQVFRILLEQAKKYDEKIVLLENDLKRVRSSRDALVTKNSEYFAGLSKAKQTELGT